MESLKTDLVDVIQVNEFGCELNQFIGQSEYCIVVFRIEDISNNDVKINNIKLCDVSLKGLKHDIYLD